MHLVDANVGFVGARHRLSFHRGRLEDDADVLSFLRCLSESRASWDLRRMGRSTCPVPVLLPKSWPKHACSAILHVLSLAHFALTHSRSWAANCRSARVRLRGEIDKMRQENALLREELRIKDARMEKIEPRRRPHYSPTERLAILELKAARGWSGAQTARRFMIRTVTIGSWFRRLDEDGPDALVKTPGPVNEFPHFVTHVVKSLRRLCPSLGKRKIAETLARAGLHLGQTTVMRMLVERDGSRPLQIGTASEEKGTGPVVAKRVHHVWQTDLTVVPTGGGFWVPWCPFSLPQCWPFSWWVAVVIDQYSRFVLGYAVYKKQPRAAEVHAFLTRVVNLHDASPRYLVTDKGGQFHNCAGYERWYERHHVIARFRSKERINATGVIERFFRSMKSEYLHRTLVPLRRDGFRRTLGEYVAWYHEHRPHTGLGGRTPQEVFEKKTPANRRSRFEPRAKWPRRSPCASPQAPPRARPGAELDLVVRFADKEKRLPIVELKRAA